MTKDNLRGAKEKEKRICRRKKERKEEEENTSIAFGEIA